ncbi:Fic family protein [Methanolobus sp. WCC5]|uniref:Fic family protein n=1 Tax=Methanolobus sp. WCC5 TaxID=3125785 RepID=UPI003255B06E
MRNNRYGRCNKISSNKITKSGIGIMSQNQIIVPLARQLNWSHFPATIAQRSESARIAPKQYEVNDNGTIWKFLIVQSDKAQQAKSLIEPFCWHQQYGFEWILPLNKEITPEVLRMIQIITEEMSRIDIMTALGLKDEKHFRENYQQIGIATGVIEMTVPDKPKSSKQKYRLTNAGKNLLKGVKYE